MGIKGIYAELGPGRRVALAKLATEHLEETGRPLRLAVDISIWLFQIQAAKGGSNPAIRTLFYRLARLMSVAIEPVFVFDGPMKPAFKRNKRSVQGDRTSAALSKRLIDLFGFVSHDAPGEAEAECALLQRQGIVDAVLSEDVDTIMFGCTRTLRNWTSEGRGSKTPSHVSMYAVDDEGFRKSGLDREGMVLVALMSGGDYLPEGIPGCGPKVACEAARAGFGKSLCKLKRADADGLRAWRENLILELRTNESGYFRTRHRALAIPESFPNLDVLRYYTHPVVSGAATIEQLKAEGEWNKGVKMVDMRMFVEETFDWTFRIGADKLIRVLAPSLLVQKLMAMYQRDDLAARSEEVVEQEEAALLRKISGRRAHVSTDGIQELRAQFIPSEIAGLDLEAEVEAEVASFGRDGLALNSDNEFEDVEAAAVAKKRFDPTQPDAMWISESILKLGAPLMVEDFEAEERRKLARKNAPKSTTATKTKTTSRGKKVDPPLPAPAQTLDSWVRVTKPRARLITPNNLPTVSPKKSSGRLPAPSRARSTTGIDGTRPREPPASPRSKSKPKHTSPSSSASALPSIPVSQAARPRTPSAGPRSAAAPTADALGAAPVQETPGEGALVSPPPRLRMPSEPLDTPPWLKALGEATKKGAAEKGAVARGEEATPSRGRKAAGRTTTPTKKQGTLDAFVSGDAAAARPDRRAQLPPQAKARTARVGKGPAAGGSGTLFPVTKVGRPRAPASDKRGGGAAGRAEAAGLGGAARLYDPFTELSDEGGGGVFLGGKASRRSDVSVIDLTGDD